MFFRVLAGYKDVVKIDEHRRDITKDAIHQPLKGLCSILETEGHTEEFPEAKRCGSIRATSSSSVVMDLSILTSCSLDSPEVTVAELLASVAVEATRSSCNGAVLLASLAALMFAAVSSISGGLLMSTGG